MQKQMASNEAMRRLQDIQAENAQLHERINILKQQRAHPDATSESREVDLCSGEIESFKNKLASEEQEIIALKRQLSYLIQRQEEFQRQIEEEHAQLSHVLLPSLRQAEEETSRFYDKLLAQFEGSTDFDLSHLRQLVQKVEAKRKVIADEIDESQRIQRHIRYTKAQAETSTPMVRADPDSTVFENPLPCLTVSAESMRRRRRATVCLRRQRKADD